MVSVHSPSGSRTSPDRGGEPGQLARPLLSIFHYLAQLSDLLFLRFSSWIARRPVAKLRHVLETPILWQQDGSMMGRPLSEINWRGKQLCIDTRYCSSFADLYTPTFLGQLTTKAGQSRLKELVRHSAFCVSNSTKISFEVLFEAIYELLLRFYRCEYVYKNTLASKIIVENHSVDDSFLFMEFWANNSKADVVIVNGTTTVYEIKTELDSFRRLAGQIASYKKLFDEVNVVTHPSITTKVCSILDADIGVIELTSENDLLTVRKAKSDLDRLEPGSVFDSLRHTEYLTILANEFGLVPDFPNTERYTQCKQLFSRMSSQKVHKHFVQALRNRGKRKFLKQLIRSVPYSLRALFLSAQFSPKVSASIQTALKGELSVK